MKKKKFLSLLERIVEAESAYTESCTINGYYNPETLNLKEALQEQCDTASIIVRIARIKRGEIEMCEIGV